MPNAPGLPPLKPKHTPPPRGTTTERGYGNDHQKQRKILIARHPVCQRCGEDWSEHLHHIDGNTFNRDAGNVVMLCERCHQAEHQGK